jgi:hypothetical protein
MRGYAGTIVLVLVLVAAAGAAYAIHEIIPSETTPPMPSANAEKLNDYVLLRDPYKAWSLWPGSERLHEGRSPHGELLTTFVNQTAYFGAKDRQGMKNGAIIVKENYTKDKEFIGLSVMYKLKGYNPEAGDWFFAFFNPDGTAKVAGKPQNCIDCHITRRGNDFIFSGPVK